MNMDLMGTAGFQFQGNKAVPVFFFYDPVVSHGPFAMVLIDDSLDDGTGFSGERGIDRAAVRKIISSDNGQIFPADFMAEDHG